MSETALPHLLHRLWNTPLRDMLRFRLNTRLDWRARLAVAELPAPARKMIEGVVQRTRLWRIEKAAVADELASHVRNALEAGQSLDAILGSFGDPRQAARLIRRARIRSRPFLWHAMRWIMRGVELLIAAYAAITLLFFLSHPSPSVNYLDELNQPIVAVPVADRAWPAYRQMMLELTGKRPVEEDGRWTQMPAWLYASVGDKNWPEGAAWLRSHRANIDALQSATARPALGFVLGPDGSVNDPELWPGMGAQARREWAEFSSLTVIPTPYAPCIRRIADVLSADARLAQAGHDGSRVERDIRAMIDLAQQLRGNDQFYADGEIALSVDKVALDEIERVLRADPKTLSDQQLIGLAHRIARPQSAADLFSLRVSQLSFYDIIQHGFTDDGRGNGHLTADGMQFLMYVNATRWTRGVPNTDTTKKIRIVANAFGPSLMMVTASRQQLLDRYNRMMDTWEANLRLPLREIARDGPSAVLQDDGDSGQSDLKFKFFDSLGITPRTFAMSVDSEKYLGHRDGVMTAIALELYRRRTGAFPKALDQLVPTYLPAIPADRITGQPIKYRLADGKPVLYSVGVDRIDDGGKPALNEGKSVADAAAQWWPSPPIPHGDWILYPVTSEHDPE